MHRRENNVESSPTSSISSFTTSSLGVTFSRPFTPLSQGIIVDETEEPPIEPSTIETLEKFKHRVEKCQDYWVPYFEEREQRFKRSVEEMEDRMNDALGPLVERLKGLSDLEELIRSLPERLAHLEGRCDEKFAHLEARCDHNANLCARLTRLIDDMKKLVESSMGGRLSVATTVESFKQTLSTWKPVLQEIERRSAALQALLEHLLSKFPGMQYNAPKLVPVQTADPLAGSDARKNPIHGPSVSESPASLPQDTSGDDGDGLMQV
ncbi:hypothetical protein SISSUDRAFT_1037281 [Sistotremastrum suecicum HHB10207 ss-3]|uniref:Uncharacterized protein n=1 Tax=Sistotremastrum suecicum HHB10207 ss-3 TaxID=1314776 RepID=A0A165YCJ9_9AGAM|nr:hypothetical protein SISSUDRAFT_1037281 [Sistotremastrum suecicum HHB10207 ss-3]